MFSKESIPLYEFNSDTLNEVPFFDVVSLAMYTGLTPQEVYNIADTANTLYKTYWIDKDTGKFVRPSEGLRLRRIDAPQPKLKALQSAITELLLKLKYHECNYGFIAGKSILDAAQAVAKGDILWHTDVKDFFPSHTALMIKKRLLPLLEERFPGVFSSAFFEVLLKLMLFNNKLPQGSPCSPILTVVLNYDMDVKLETFAKSHDLTYARYVDDITFSGKMGNYDAVELLEELAQVIHPLKLNYKKCGIMKTSTKPIARGVVLKSDKVMPATMASRIASIIRAQIQNVKITSSPNRIEAHFKHTGSLDEYKELVASILDKVNKRYPSYDIKARRMFFYIQSTRTMLGLHIEDERVIYPRATYEVLRLQSMLMGMQRAYFYLKHVAQEAQLPGLELMLKMSSAANKPMEKPRRNLLTHPFNRRKFNGKRSYIGSVDPKKAEQLQAMENKFFIKWINKLVDDYVKKSSSQNGSILKSITRRYYNA